MMMGLILALMVLGGIAVSTASIAVAKTYNVDSYFFAKRQFVFIALAWPLLVSMSFLTPKGVKQVGWLLFVASLAGVIATFFVGVDVKGATRWIHLMGVSVQPTEFLKPALVIATATLLAHKKVQARHRGFLISLVLMGLVAGLVILQPDFSTTLMLGTVWFAQILMAGIPFVWLFLLMLLGLVGIVAAYSVLPHVRSRIERFLNPENSDTYQVDQGMEALLSGGFFGRGAGEGVVKHHLPDAHTDFIFAVIGEEFGIIACLFFLVLYGVIILRAFSKVLDHKDTFTLIAGSGLLLLFSLQVLVNIGVVLGVLPTTGMTLPFVSYGGSSMLAMVLTMGLVLALIRKRGRRYGHE